MGVPTPGPKCLLVVKISGGKTWNFISNPVLIGVTGSNWVLRQNKDHLALNDLQVALEPRVPSKVCSKFLWKTDKVWFLSDKELILKTSVARRYHFAGIRFSLRCHSDLSRVRYVDLVSPYRLSSWPASSDFISRTWSEGIVQLQDIRI